MNLQNKKNIRYATLKDIPIIIDLRILYFKEAYTTLSLEKEKELRKVLKLYFEEHLNNDCFVALLGNEGKYYSCAIINVFKKAPNGRNITGDFAEIYGVYTVKESRKRGFASEIIKFLLDSFRGTNLAFITLEASKEGESVYRRCGFVEDGFDYIHLQYTYRDKE
ncbi:TPA: GNAT family N-acetyltransferase [Streptococcus suis]